MSRVGRKPIPIPEGVKVSVEGDTVVVEGPQGRLTQRFEPEYVDVVVDDGVVRVQRKGDEKPYRARHGLYRSLIHNMVQGVVKPYEKRLQLVGLGYRARLEGRTLVLEVGYSHPVRYPLPEGVQAEVNDVRAGGVEAEIVLRSPDKQLVGEVAAQIRRIRKPEPYKGTGIRYADEQLIRKVGKLAGAK